MVAKDSLGSKALGQALALATNMLAALAVGYFAGSFLDRWLGTYPWLTIILFMLGMATGLKMMYETVVKIKDEEEAGGEKEKGPADLKERLQRLKEVREQLRETAERLQADDWTNLDGEQGPQEEEAAAPEEPGRGKINSNAGDPRT